MQTSVKFHRLQVLTLLVVAGYLPLTVRPLVAGPSYRGNLSFQSQYFTANTDKQLDRQFNQSVSGSVEFTHDLDGSNTRLTIAPFFRLDQRDSNRSQLDFRELNVSAYGDGWEWRVGIGEEFWGVAESRNVVDVINQRDLAENPAAPAKLGQPMLSFTWLRESGDYQLFILPGFRERTFTGPRGRPALFDSIDIDQPLYESGSDNNHVDIAARYTNSLDEWDVGVSLFRGTSRDPVYRQQPDSAFFRPTYLQIRQAGVDLQGTFESWLLKFEMVHVEGPTISTHNKSVVGAEYSFYDIKQSGIDISLLGEYVYDGLGESAIESFQDELVGGVRLAMNDEQSTDVLLVVAYDLEDDSQFFSLQGSRRIGSNSKLTVEAVTYSGENYFGVTLGYFF